MKKKFKSYRFWVAVISAIILFIQNMGEIFGYVISAEISTNTINAVCTILVFLGFLNPNDELAEMDNTEMGGDENINAKQ